MSKNREEFLWCFLVHTKISFVLILICGVLSIVFAQSNWLLHSTQITSNCLRSTISTASYFSFPGKCYISGDSGTIISSTNNNSWIDQQSGTINDLYAIFSDAIAGGPAHNILAAGKNGIIIVSEVISGTWQNKISGTDITLRSISSGGPCRVVVGDSGLILTAPSVNSAWSLQVSGTKRNLRSVFFPSIEGPNGSFTVVGDSGTILTSKDGISWTIQTSGTIKNLKSVASGDLCCSGARTVAVGDSGIILTSADGVIWNRQTSGTTNTLWAICSVEDIINLHSVLYVAVGELGTILTSKTDGNSGVFNPGVVWTSQITGTNKNLYGVGISAKYDSLIAVGDSGTILTSYCEPLITGIKQEKSPTKQQCISITNNTIHYALQQTTRMAINLYDTKGRLVKAIVNRMQQTGLYSVSLPNNLSPGVYTMAFKAGNHRIDKVIILGK